MNVYKIIQILFIILCISIGFYPLVYLFADMSQGLLGTKPPELLSEITYTLFFRLHIFFSGVALLIGWSQFLKSFRDRNLRFHRLVGKVYIISVMVSGLSGLYISYYATGGLSSVFGFSALAVLWLTTTILAYRTILQKRKSEHEQWMIRSYSLTFAAVTLRLWMPVLIGLFGMDFFDAYPIIAWLCWVPNLAVSEYLFVRKIRS